MRVVIVGVVGYVGGGEGRCSLQISAKRGTDSSFAVEANIKALYLSRVDPDK